MSDMMMQEEAMNMSNEQAVQILIPMKNMMCDQNGYPISDAVFALDKAIEALSADRPTWISCSERLPETKSVDDWVKALVCSANGGMAVGSFNSEYGWTFSHYFDAVVAWMPLLKPWEGADE